jgi:hypothetical protein
MTRRDIGKLCIFPTQKTLRENAQPYRFWGLLGFPPRSEGRTGSFELDNSNTRGVEYKQQAEIGVCTTERLLHT